MCSIKPESYYALKESLGTPEELISMAALMQHPGPTSFKKSVPICSKRIIAPPETEVVFNLSCEPAYKFSLPAFADYGCEPRQRTSNMLQNNVLYIEADNKRYEISKEKPNSASKVETYRLAEVLNPFVHDNEFMAQHSIPLDLSSVKVKFLLYTDRK